MTETTTTQLPPEVESKLKLYVYPFLHQETIDLLRGTLAQAIQDAVERERERLQPAVEIAEAIADLRAFDKETGHIWQHWIDKPQKAQSGKWYKTRTISEWNAYGEALDDLISALKEMEAK